MNSRTIKPSHTILLFSYFSLLIFFLATSQFYFFLISWPLGTNATCVLGQDDLLVVYKCIIYKHMYY